MFVVQQLLERNQRGQRSLADLPIEPKLRAIILACSDHRADPAHVLGLEAGEAVVIRNAGGRVTPGVLSDLAVLSTVGRIEGLASGFEFIVMHHTDCGTSRLGGDEHKALLAGYFGIESEAVQDKRVDDPAAAVAHDVHLLRSYPWYLTPCQSLASSSTWRPGPPSSSFPQAPKPFRRRRREPVSATAAARQVPEEPEGLLLVRRSPEQGRPFPGCR